MHRRTASSLRIRVLQLVLCMLLLMQASPLAAAPAAPAAQSRSSASTAQAGDPTIMQPRVANPLLTPAGIGAAGQREAAAALPYQTIQHPAQQPAATTMAASQPVSTAACAPAPVPVRSGITLYLPIIFNAAPA